MSELKPCPFCGGSVFYETESFDLKTYYKASIMCRRCGIRVSYHFDVWLTLDCARDIIEQMWNRRVNDGTDKA